MIRRIPHRSATSRGIMLTPNGLASILCLVLLPNVSSFFTRSGRHAACRAPAFQSREEGRSRLTTATHTSLTLLQLETDPDAATEEGNQADIPAVVEPPERTVSTTATDGKASRTDDDDEITVSTPEDAQNEIDRLCYAGEIGPAIRLLRQWDRELQNPGRYYVKILNVMLLTIESEGSVNGKQTSLLANGLLDRMIELGRDPTAVNMELPNARVFDKVIRLWAYSSAPGSVKHCRRHLETLWSLHRELGGENKYYVPFWTSYLYAIHACSSWDQSVASAEQAEVWMEDMNKLCVEYPRLRPDRLIVNKVMNAWSKSGHRFKSVEKCESLLDEMIELAETGREDMVPDAKSFNICINALAQSKVKSSEYRAEDLLQRMEKLSTRFGGWEDCQPDVTSFNSVINSWAESRLPNAAQRATDILDHMKKRYDGGFTSVYPTFTTYSTVLKAWARSREEYALEQAEAIFHEYQALCDEGKGEDLSHNAFTYNSMINCFAKSFRNDAGDRALELLETMKSKSGAEGWELCFVDVYSYTSTIDALSKQKTFQGSELAISLLHEVEKAFGDSDQESIRFQPNIQLYTSCVNAIGRSQTKPERAQQIVDRVESDYHEGRLHRCCKPDVVFYNALINAYGWSDAKGRSQKAFDTLERMIHLYTTGKNEDAKPDTISFNSVLNACAYERTDSQVVNDEILKIAVSCLETLQDPECDFGRPSQATYNHILVCIGNLLPEGDERRISMAESAFLQCAKSGLVGPRTVLRLHRVIPYSRLEALLGPALLQGQHSDLQHNDDPSKPNRKINFDLSLLPAEWTSEDTRSNRKGRRGPPKTTRSRRRKDKFQVTKNILQNTISKERRHQEGHWD